jgi:hypothetical protein
MMTLHRRKPAACLAAIAALLLSQTAGAGFGVSPAAGSPDPPCAPVEHAAVVERHYTLNARVRPLLLWIARSNVGGARIVWSRWPDGSRRVELLIGSDPQRAPMQINRWGYLVETVCGDTADLVGVMTETKEQSIEDAHARVVREPGGAHAFKALHSRVAVDETSATVTRFVLSHALTYRDVETLLRRHAPAGAAVRRLRLPRGAEPGFLVALTGLLRDSVSGFLASGRVPERSELCRVYTYDARLYDLTLRSSKFISTSEVNGRVHHAAIESEFEVRNRTTRGATSFRITYGTRGAMAEVPLRIVYRAKWWFEAELLLEEGAVF